MKIIIPTCDKYRNILEANKYTMDKFGGSNLDITILGYKKPEFDMGNWKFFCLGNDNGADNFTNDIYNFFKDFKDEYFIYGNDDIVAVDELNIEMINEFKKLMDNDDKVVKICLTSAAPSVYGNDIYKNGNDYNFIKLPNNGEYRLSLHYGVWRTSYFMKYFELGISPWEWELRDVAKNDGAIILGTDKKHVLDFGHILRRGGMITETWYKSLYTNKQLNDDDIQYVKKIIENL